jgi:hypothetical protein
MDINKSFIVLIRMIEIVSKKIFGWEGNYTTYKLEIKTFKLRINDEQTIKCKEKRKDKI